MQHFYVIKFPRWKRWFIVTLFALIADFFISIERDGAFSVFESDEPVVLSKGSDKEENIALTFNISWGEERVHHILDKLNQHDVQATFFVSGEWAERHPEIVEKIVENNHELGMLGYRYKSYLDQEIDQVRRDLLQALETFSKLGHKDIRLLRTPSGHFNKDIIELAEQLDFKVIHWNVNPNDWKNPGSEAIIDTVMKETSNGDIILMHASDSAKQTANALETILPGLTNKGFHFVSISELINQAHADSELVE